MQEENTLKENVQIKSESTVVTNTTNTSANKKKYITSAFLALWSLFFGAVLGKLNIFGFLEGQHTLSIALLISSLLLNYFIVITLFILDLTDINYMRRIFIACSICFGLSTFLFSLYFVLSLFITLFYYTYLNLIYNNLQKRTKLFIKFIPQEIFFPVLKKGFLYLLIILALLSFFRAQQRLNNNNFISSSNLKLISKPFIAIFNQQFNNQLKTNLGEKFQQIPSAKLKEKDIREMLDKTIITIAESQSKYLFGIQPEEIPTEKAIIYATGEVDITPVIDAMYPALALRINERIAPFAFIIPLVIALFTILILQPFILPFQIIEGTLSLLIIRILIQAGILKKYTETIQVERVSLN